MSHSGKYEHEAWVNQQEWVNQSGKYNLKINRKSNQAKMRQLGKNESTGNQVFPNILLEAT